MAKDYSSLGLDAFLQSTSSLLSQNQLSAYQVDSQNEPSAGAIDYSRITSTGRTYQALVSLSKTGGAFTDIQSAINHVSRLGGGNILVSPGTYLISSEVTLASNIGIEGVGNRRSIFEFNSGTVGFVSPGTAISIRNLVFQNSLGTVFNFTGTPVVAGLDIKIENCFFDANTACIYGTNVDNFRIQNNTGNGCVDFVTIDTSKAAGVFITGNFMGESLSGRNFIKINNGTSVMIENNYIFSDSRGTSIVTLGTSNRCMLVGNGFIWGATGGTSTDGIKLINSDFNAMTGNAIVSGNAGTCYAVNISDTTSGSNVVVGNYLKGFTAQTNNLGTGNVIANNA